MRPPRYNLRDLGPRNYMLVPWKDEGSLRRAMKYYGDILACKFSMEPVWGTPVVWRVRRVA